MKELRSIRQLDNRQLSQKIKYALFENIKESIHGNELLKLPKEEVLAQQLGVSRNGLRDVLTVLEEEGYISRRRSKGTIVNPKIVNSTCRLDLETELTQMIAEEGYEPGFETLQIKFVEEEDPVLGPEEKRYLLVEKVFYADNDPVAYSLDRFAGTVAVKGAQHMEQLRASSHFDFMEQCCNDSIACVLADIIPVLPGENIARLLQISADTPVLCLEDTGFNYDHTTVLHATLYLKSGKLNYKILRKRF